MVVFVVAIVVIVRGSVATDLLRVIRICHSA